MRFDARTAKLLKPGEHIILDGRPGLRLQASESRRSWIYRYKSPVDGRMRQTVIGRWPEMSEAAAIGAWEALRALRESGVDPVAEKRQARTEAAPAAKQARYSVRDVVDDYLAGHVDVHRKPKGATEVRRIMDRQLGELSNVKASTLTRSQAFDFLEKRMSTPVQTALLRQELGAAWDYALDAGRLPETAPNWWRLIMRGRLRSKGKVVEGKHVGAGKRALSGDEVGTLIRWLPNFPALADDALTLYLWTAARGAEIMAMHASEITEEQDGLWWTVPKAKTKNARIQLATDLRVPLVGRAEVIVRRRLKNAAGGYLFPSPGRFGHVEQKTIGVAVHYRLPHSKTHPHLERARLPVTAWSPHDLRRTSRTLLASLQCPDSVAEAILGHVQPGVQGVYNRHGYDKERRKWLTALDAKLEQLARGKPFSG
ncbi:integrase [Variovorax paradoxus]|uniref:tyrosine-type recombinase/integrase n=1 Tax=Variovorax atrisoli TaxID=3394203 RepID=UPI00119B4BC6|nr:integrase family protein [Variovorax paradoxus]MDR6521813.1 integrase [Variovorax paradoxus]